MHSNLALSKKQINRLLAFFDYDIVENRKSDGQRQLPHQYVRAALSEIFGPLGWSEQTISLTEINLGRQDGFAAVAYKAQVRLLVHPNGPPGAFWDGGGAWGLQRSDRTPEPVWEMHSDCMNGALSVALCRATKNLGNAFGLSLYDEPDDGYTRVRRFLPYEEDDPEPDKEPTQYTLDPDQETGDHPRENDPT